MRRLGVMTSWGREYFIEGALNQAIDLVDEVAVTSVPMHPVLKRYEDKTEEVARWLADKNDQITYLPVLPDYDISWEQNMASILNQLLNKLKPEENDLVWLLDSDEFYDSHAKQEINEWLDVNKDFCSLRFKAYMVGPDMDHGIISYHTRLHRFWKGRCFVPTSYFIPRQQNPPVILNENPMFHYSTAVPLEMKAKFWEVEFGVPYPDKQQAKIDWCKRIYRNYDVEDERVWIIKNKELTGNQGYWFTDNVEEKPGGGLFSIQEHPYYIEDVKSKIFDFRKDFPVDKLPLAFDLNKSKALTGVVFGVGYGAKIKAILEEYKIDKLFLVDPFEEDDLFNEALEFLADYKNELRWLRMSCKEALESLLDSDTYGDSMLELPEDHVFDFIFADLEALYQDKKLLKTIKTIPHKTFIVDSPGVKTDFTQALNLVEVEDGSFRTKDAYSDVLVAGPWAGEFGYELMLFNPAVRALSKEYDKTIVIVPKGHEALYEDFADEIIVHDISFGIEDYKFNTRGLSFWDGDWDQYTNTDELKEKTKHLRNQDYHIVENGKWLLESDKEFINLANR